jgi:hypothetical protein
LASAAPADRPTLAIEKGDSGVIRIQLTGEPERTYVLESTLDFAGWTQLGDPMRSSSVGVVIFPDIPIAGGHHRFYRCRETQ